MLKNNFYLASFILLFSSSINADSMGALLFHGNCITCHAETKTLSAPSIMEVRENYLRAFPNKENFVEYMSDWVIKPKKESSIMLEAVDKHGLMPELGYDKETLETISAYIYETDFTQKHAGHKE
ncbi:MAG: cytochrome C [Pseudomonadota bacterium]